MEIKKNPTIISPAKNATTYVEDGTGTLEPEGIEKIYRIEVPRVSRDIKGDKIHTTRRHTRYGSRGGMKTRFPSAPCGIAARSRPFSLIFLKNVPSFLLYALFSRSFPSRSVVAVRSRFR